MELFLTTKIIQIKAENFANLATVNPPQKQI
jgi:hypothetical protein